MFSSNSVDSLGGVLITPVQGLVESVLLFLPQLAGSLFVLIVGIILARIIINFLGKILSKIKLDTIFEKIGLTKELKSVGFNYSIEKLFLSIISFFLKLGVWLAAINVLNVPKLNDFVERITGYIPDVIGAVIILIAGIAIAKVAEKIVNNAGSSLEFSKSGASAASKVAKVSVIIFTGLIVFSQLGIGASLINTLFTGIVFALSIALGLSFGLGGQKRAAEIIERLSK